MGKVWTGLIVTQIAATVVFTATAYVVHRQAEYIASVETVFPTPEVPLSAARNGIRRRRGRGGRQHPGATSAELRRCSP